MFQQEVPFQPFQIGTVTTPYLTCKTTLPTEPLTGAAVVECGHPQNYNFKLGLIANLVRTYSTTRASEHEWRMWGRSGGVDCTLHRVDTSVSSSTN